MKFARFILGFLLLLSFEATFPFASLAQGNCSDGEVFWTFWKNTPTLAYEIDKSFFLETPRAKDEDPFGSIVPTGGYGLPQRLVRLSPEGDIFQADLSAAKEVSWKKLSSLSDCQSQGCRIVSLQHGGPKQNQVFLQRRSDGSIYRLRFDEQPPLQKVSDDEGLLLGVLSDSNDSRVKFFWLHEQKIWSRFLLENGSFSERISEFEGMSQNPLFLFRARKQTVPALAFQFAETRTGTLNAVLLGVAERRGQIVGSFEPLLLEWPKRSFPLDANGDSRIDLLASRSPSRNAYVAIEDAEGYFEKQIQLPGADFSVDIPLLGFDFNEDGLDDLYFYSVRKKGILRAFSRAAQRLSGLEILLPESSTQRKLTSEGGACLPAQQIVEGGALRILGKTYQIVLKSAEGFSGRVLLRELGSHGERFSLDTAPVPPYVCVGYHAMSFQEDGNSKWGRRESYCPPHSAHYFTTEADREPTANITARLPCCPLPGEDILAQKQVRVAGSCPDGMVVVGSVPLDPSDFHSPRDLICSPVSERYQLGPETGGFYVGRGYSARAHTDRLRMDQVPAAIRAATNRLEFDYWYGDGCIGVPFGSLFTARTEQGRGCSRTRFRQLQYRGLPGDPAKGTPVRMFPDCISLDNIFRPDARCAF